MTVTGIVTLTDGSVLSVDDTDQAGYRTTTLPVTTDSTTSTSTNQGAQGTKSTAPTTVAIPPDVPGVPSGR